MLNLNGYGFGLFWEGLIAYYPFDGNANDESGNSNNGTVYGATLSPDRFGNTNSCYLFDGVSQYIQAGISNIPTNAQDRTLSIWEKFTGNPDTAGTYIPAAWGTDADNEAFGIMAQFGSAPIQWHVQFWGGGEDVNSGVAVDTNWHQIVAEYGNGVAELFIDGVLTVSDTKPTGTGFSSLCIGTGVEIFIGGATYFPGYIDDVRIYNQALPSNAVASLYALEADVPVITQQPQSQTVNAGSTVSFSVTATAINPLTYQWSKNGVALSGATNTTLTITNIQTEQIGYYSVTVSNDLVGVTSTNAALNLAGYNFSFWNGLVAYYPFDGNVNDASGNGNNGTNYGATLTDDRFGNTNGAYSFNGSAWIDIGSVVFRYDVMSLSAWINTTSVSSFSDEAAIVSKPNDPRPGTLTGSRLGTYQGAFDSGFASDETNFINIALFGSVLGSGPANNGIWHQGVYVNDGTNLQLFVDGQLLGVDTYSPQVSTSAEPMLIGQEFPTNWNLPGNRNFTGSIDDVRVYNRALSSIEVAALYALELPKPTIEVSDGNLGFTSGQFGFDIGGMPGETVVIEISTDLQNWIPIQTNMLGSSPFYFTDPQSSTNGTRFYRVQAQ